jgi:hypothetical protein|eukprot:COSAG06_NODE_32925_length_498_cov_0.636591_1_plen_111_part_00
MVLPWQVRTVTDASMIAEAETAMGNVNGQCSGGCGIFNCSGICGFRYQVNKVVEVTATTTMMRLMAPPVTGALAQQQPPQRWQQPFELAPFDLVQVKGRSANGMTPALIP